MEKSSYKKIKTIQDAINESLDYIDGRRLGTIKSLRTRWNKLNSICMGGIEPNSMYTIAGISGSGKSAFANMIESDILDLNPTENVVILSFSFEMLSSRQISRKLSKVLKRTTQSLYSIDSPITDGDMTYINNAASGLKKYPIYYVDEPMDVAEIQSTIEYFQQNIAKDKWLIVILDHTLLLEFSYPENEQTVITQLQKVFLKLKKVGKTTIIQLSQLNRDIEKTERINNNMSHYPMRSDISTTDKVYQASDYVFAIHIPEKLNISYYGKNNIPTKDMVFLHIIKNREGSVGIIMFQNELMYNNLTEI